MWKREKGDMVKNVKKNTLFIVDGDIDIIYDTNSINLTYYTNYWVIDSGVSFMLLLSIITSHSILMVIMAMSG